MGKFYKCLTELSAQDTPIFWFLDDTLSKHQWSFTKLGMCIDIVKIWFGIANKFRQCLTELSARNMAGYCSLTFLLSYGSLNVENNSFCDLLVNFTRT